MNSLKNPLNLLSKWRKEEILFSNNNVLACLSTIGLDGFPNSRIMTVKDIIDNTIIITGPLRSRKGREIEANNKVAITFCWQNTSRQVRIQGVAERLPDELADKYFQQKATSAKAVSIVCEQGEKIVDESKLKQKIALELSKKISQSSILPRPDSWGGYSIHFHRIEFMQYHETNFHRREFYELENGEWNKTQIQP